MSQDVSSSVDRSALVALQAANASDVKTPLDNLVTLINNILNGSQAFDAVKYQAATIKTLSSDAFTRDLNTHIVAAQTGTADDLSTINGGINGQSLFLQADTGDTITVKHAVGNINLNNGADYALSGTKTLMLWYNGTGWADIAPTVSPAAPAPGENLLVNWSLETWNGGTAAAPQGWTLTGAGATIAREGTIIKHGDYSAKLTRVGTDCHISRDVYSDERTGKTYMRSRQYTFGAWVYATVASRARLRFDDGVTVSNSSYHTGGSAWEFLTVTKTLSGSATKCEVGLAVDTGNTSGYIDMACLIEGSSLSSTPPPNDTLNRYPRRASMFHRDSIVITGNALTINLDASQQMSHYAFQNAAAINDEFSQSFWLEAGTYTLKYTCLTASASGIITWYVDGESQGTVDGYSAGTTYNVVKTLSITVRTSGYHVLRGVTASKNASSSGYQALLTFISIVPGAD